MVDLLLPFALTPKETTDVSVITHQKDCRRDDIVNDPQLLTDVTKQAFSKPKRK
jgi:hypothetical protein